MEDGDYDQMAKIVKRRRRINKSAVHAEIRLLRHQRDVENAQFDARLTKLAQMLFYDGHSDFREGDDAVKYRPVKQQGWSQSAAGEAESNSSRGRRGGGASR